MVHRQNHVGTNYQESTLGHRNQKGTKCCGACTQKSKEIHASQDARDQKEAKEMRVRRMPGWHVLAYVSHFYRDLLVHFSSAILNTKLKLKFLS